MVVPGTLNDISASLAISIPAAGQLISAAALLMCLGAPLLAGVVSTWDRRQLLTGCLLWYGVMHMVCAAMPSFETLLVTRVLTVVSPAGLAGSASGTQLAVGGRLSPPAAPHTCASAPAGHASISSAQYDTARAHSICRVDSIRRFIVCAPSDRCLAWRHAILRHRLGSDANGHHRPDGRMTA